MSARPSSSRSSFTLPAAVWVSWIIVPPVGPASCLRALPYHSSGGSDVPALRAFLPEVCGAGPGRRPKLLRGRPEHRVGRAGGRPDLLVAEEVLIDERREPPGGPDRGHPSDGITSPGPDLVGARPPV